MVSRPFLIGLIDLQSFKIQEFYHKTSKMFNEFSQSRGAYREIEGLAIETLICFRIKLSRSFTNEVMNFRSAIINVILLSYLLWNGHFQIPWYSCQPCVTPCFYEVLYQYDPNQIESFAFKVAGDKLPSTSTYQQVLTCQK